MVSFVSIKVLIKVAAFWSVLFVYCQDFVTSICSICFSVGLGDLAVTSCALGALYVLFIGPNDFVMDLKIIS